MQLALYQPDIAPNFGAAVRLSVCLGATLHFIEPCGFPLSDKALKRVALDYGAHITPVRHIDFACFLTAVNTAGSRIVAIETGQSTQLYDFAFQTDDILLMGSETKGLPQAALDSCDARVTIPMQAHARSLNLVNAAAIALGEGLRQTRWS